MTIIGLEDESHKTRITTSNGKEVLLGGIIDRMDRMGGKTRIIDYKTGKVEENDVKVKTDDLEKIPDKALQLIIYKYLYLRNHKDVPEDKVEMSLVSFRRNKDEMNAVLDIDEDTELYRNFMDQTEKMLTELVSNEIFNPEIPFTQTDKESNCRICNFKTICNKSIRSY